ncbi:unnamed protein product, partial [Polarella glacialis]
HRPRHLGEVIGNTDQVRKLAEWLRDWDEVVLRGKTKEIPAQDPNKKFQPAPDNVNARAVIVSGPPGIGKTTTCSLVARCSRHYKLMEFNASDARSKLVIDSMSNSLAGNRTLKFGSGGNSLERAVIIMDECDGMDPGGTQALIKLIKTTKNPVICICNDRQDRNIRDLATHCLDLKFKRPDNMTVAKRIKGIMEGNGKSADLASIESVVEACGQDIRQVINHVQFFGSIGSGNSRTCQKDSQVMLSPFDACSRLLSVKKDPMPLDKRLDLFYIDPDFMPLMVHENYLRPLDRRAGGLDEVSVLERAAKASELIATADVMSGNFELGNATAMMGTIYPSALMSSPDETFLRPTFPAFFQKRGALTKVNRVLQELAGRVKASTTCGSSELVTSGYHDVLHRKLLKPLMMGQVQQCAQALQSYGLTREFFTDQAPLLRNPLQMEDGYRKVEPKNKVALLQEIQSLSQKAQPVKRKRVDDAGSGNPFGKRQSKGGSSGGGYAVPEDADDGEEADTNAVEDESIPGLVQNKRSSKQAPKIGAKNVKAKVDDYKKCSLATWRVKKELPLDENGQVQVEVTRAAILVIRYIEGHTCAVRRKVHMQDLLGSWTLF